MITVRVPKLIHKRRIPKKTDRGKFSQSTRAIIIERDQGLCQICMSEGQSVHHIIYRSQMGRGVYTNGIVLCADCHTKVHRDRELSDYLVNMFADRYGAGFWKDGYDE